MLGVSCHLSCTYSTFYIGFCGYVDCMLMHILRWKCWSYRPLRITCSVADALVGLVVPALSYTLWSSSCSSSSSEASNVNALESGLAV